MSRNDPIGAILGVFLAIGSFFVELILGRLFLLIRGILDLLWYVSIELPMRINEIFSSFQTFQYLTDILHNFTTNSPLQATFQSISPFAGIIWNLFGFAILGYILLKIILPAIAESL